MKLFAPNPQILQLDDKIVGQLSHGLMVYSASLGYPNGIRAIAVRNQLPDGSYAIKCHVFDYSGVDEHGTTWSNLKELGFLTEEAAKKMTEHIHDGCHTKLEVRSDG